MRELPATTRGRWIDVAPERFPAWVVGFGRRHGALTVTGEPATVTFHATDGAVAACYPPFPPVDRSPTNPDDPASWAAVVAAHAAAPRTVGVLLVRLGGYAAGVFTGAPPRLVAARTGSRPVHGRSAAGGWSQRRFARRRENQATAALRAAADAADAILGEHRGSLDAVVLGGDRQAIARLRDDPRLRPHLALAVDRFLTVPDPRRTVLQDSPRLFRAVRVRLTEPADVDR